MAFQVTLNYLASYPWLLDVVCQTLATDSEAPWSVTVTREVDESGKEEVIEGALVGFTPPTPDTDSMIAVQPRRFFDGRFDEHGKVLSVPLGPPVQIRVEDIRDLSVP